MTLEHQHVVVIGGSSGIGLAIASAVHARGARVTLVGRSPERLEAAAGQLGSRVERHAADATDEARMRELFERGEVHHVVLTPVHAYYAPIRTLELPAARASFESKLVPALIAARHARFATGGSLLLTSGINALRPTVGAAAVAAGNGALEALARTLAAELAPVRVNVIAPGWTDTPLWDVVAGDAKAARFEAQAAKLPVRRIGRAEDVADAACALLTNGFITGALLRVDGGHAFA